MYPFSRVKKVSSLFQIGYRNEMAVISLKLIFFFDPRRSVLLGVTNSNIVWILEKIFVAEYYSSTSPPPLKAYKLLSDYGRKKR